MVKVWSAGTEVEAKLLTVNVVLVATVKAVTLLALNVPELVKVPLIHEVTLLALNVPELVSEDPEGVV